MVFRANKESEKFRYWVWKVEDSFEAERDGLEMSGEDGSRVPMSVGFNSVSYEARENCPDRLSVVRVFGLVIGTKLVSAKNILYYCNMTDRYSSEENAAD